VCLLPKTKVRLQYRLLISHLNSSIEFMRMSSSIFFSLVFDQLAHFQLLQTNVVKMNDFEFQILDLYWVET